MQEPTVNHGSEIVNSNCPVDLEDVWKKVVALVANVPPPRGHSLTALCSFGRIKSHDFLSDEVIIEFPRAQEVTKKLIEREPNRTIIAGLLTDVLGCSPVTVAFVCEGDVEKQAKPSDAIASMVITAREKFPDPGPREVIPPPPMGQGERFFQSHLKSRCESPIEEHFARAWAMLMQERYPYANTRFFFQQYGVIPERTEVTPLHVMQIDWICQQHPIDRYRVDFLLARVCRDAGDGVEVMRKLPPVVVECDGHDFHERTKGQAQHDKSRDRKMTAMCYRVVRFTGSELHKDAMRCAKEVDELFRSLLNEQYRD